MSAASQKVPSTEGILQWGRDLVTGLLPDPGGIDDAEVGRLAKDLRISPAALRAVSRQGSHAADLLNHRMAALDLDAAEVARAEPASFRDLQRVCALCERRGRCARDLAHRPLDPAWAKYCPNAQTLAALDAMPWASRREW